MIIAVQNLGSLVTDAEAYNMTLLADRQVRDHLAPAWGIQPPLIGFLAGQADQKYDAIIGILDDADQADALGYHTEGPDAAVYGRVFARPVLDNGGGVLTGNLSVCSVLSHEVCETIGDAPCNGWHQQDNGSLAARELCDPVEGDSYELSLEATGGEVLTGTVSDFLLPAWFDPENAAGPYDYLKLLDAPFQVRDTGYVISMTGGAVTQSWGDRYPLWRAATKEHPTSRTARRDSPAVPQAEVPPTSLA